MKFGVPANVKYLHTNVMGSEVSPTKYWDHFIFALGVDSIYNDVSVFNSTNYFIESIIIIFYQMRIFFEVGWFDPPPPPQKKKKKREVLF